MKRGQQSDDPWRHIRQKNDGTKSLFDDLGMEALGNIFRHHADCPRIADWSTLGNHAALCDVSHPGHPLRAAAAQEIVRDLRPLRVAGKRKNSYGMRSPPGPRRLLC